LESVKKVEKLPYSVLSCDVSLTWIIKVNETSHDSTEWGCCAKSQC